MDDCRQLCENRTHFGSLPSLVDILVLGHIKSGLSYSFCREIVKWNEVDQFRSRSFSKWSNFEVDQFRYGSFLSIISVNRMSHCPKVIGINLDFILSRLNTIQIKQYLKLLIFCFISKLVMILIPKYGPLGATKYRLKRGERNPMIQFSSPKVKRAPSLARIM